MRVVCYARVSSERQAEKDLSIPAQLKALRKYALERNWETVGEYVDEAESARTANRPKFKEMVAAARRNPKAFDAILVWKLSRFARNREDSVIYKSLLRRHGVQVISINEPVNDSPAGKLLEGMIEVIDEFYSSNLAEDVLRGMKENAEKGYCNGGATPFGYRRAKVNVGNVQKSKLEPEESEAPIVRRVFQMALSGLGSKEIAKVLNREQITTRRGKLWGKTTIMKMMKHEVYTGSLVWTARDGEVVRHPNTHMALVSKDDFDKLQGLLNDRRSRARHPRTVTSRYLLSSLLHCASCGSPMIGCAAKSGQFLYYRCNNALRHDSKACRTGWLPKTRIEDFVVHRLKENVLTDDNLSALVKMVNEELRVLAGRSRERVEEVDRQLQGVNQKLLKYYVAFEKGTMTDDDAAPRIRALRAEQTRLQQVRNEALAHIEDAQPRVLDPGEVLAYVTDLRELLAKGSLVEQKTFLRSFVKRIDFDVAQVTINYTMPMPLGKREEQSEREVLSLEHYGGPLWSRTTDLSLIRTAL